MKAQINSLSALILIEADLVSTRDPELDSVESMQREAREYHSLGSAYELENGCVLEVVNGSWYISSPDPRSAEIEAELNRLASRFSAYVY